MRSGTWPDKPVRTVATRTILNGTEVDVDGISVTSEMTTDLPVTSAASLSSSAGSASWSQSSVVAVSAPQPFVRTASGPPPSKTPVVAQIGDGTQWWTQLTGFIDSTTGNLVSGQASSALVDTIDRLSTVVRHDPLLSAHPPVGDTGSTYRRPGLCATYCTDMFARSAGFCATPATSPANTLLSAPNMGSTWPEVGTLLDAHRNGDTASPISAALTSWGVGMSGPDATWSLVAGGRRSITVQLAEQGGCRVDFYAATQNNLGAWMSHGTDGNLTVGLSVPGDLTLITVPVNGATRAALWFNNSTDLELTLRLSDGREFPLATQTVSIWSGLYPDRLRMHGDGVMGAVMVDSAGNTADAFRALNDVPTALFRFANLHFLVAIPLLRGSTALTLLTDQAQAECASIWIDSLGRFRWASRGLLDGDSVAVTKSTDLSIDDLAWSDDLSGLRETVTVSYRSPAVRRSLITAVDLVNSEELTLASGDSDERWLSPTADEDWIDPDLTLSGISYPSYPPGPSFSLYGGVVADTNGNSSDTEVLVAQDQISISLEKIGDNYKLTTMVMALPTGKSLITRLPKDVGSWSSRSLPLIRGKALVSWVDTQDSYDAAPSAPTVTYAHDLSWYVQEASAKAALAAWIVAKVTTPVPSLTSVDIDPDPRIELGDKVQLEDRNRTGLLLHLVVTGINQGYGSGAPTMSLTGRITHVEQPWTVTDPIPAWQTLITGWSGNLT